MYDLVELKYVSAKELKKNTVKKTTYLFNQTLHRLQNKWIVHPKILILSIYLAIDVANPLDFH